MVTIPWYVNLFLLFLPLIFSTVVGIWINVLLRRINRQEGSPPWTIKKNFIMACIISSPLAAVIQMLLQSQLEPYVYIEDGSGMIIFNALVSPFLVLLGHNLCLWYFNKKGWKNAYNFVRVKHAKPPEYYADDVSDFTVKNFHNTPLNGNDKDAD